ncbi:MAG: rRNA pseudouridine synthase [Oligoflexia bacterium]|nr:rRNA pseudouridine synthase [Oligoflexia bacterium]
MKDKLKDKLKAKLKDKDVDTDKDNLVRLHKAIADSGMMSRRKAEQFILQERVRVNGEVVKELGTKVDPIEDIITVDDNSIKADYVEKVYIVFNKPRGCVTTLSDPQGRPTVMDYLGGIPGRVYPIGRLDFYSEGLLLFTNDGDLANKIMHPKHNVKKVYEVKVFGKLDQRLLEKLRKGAKVDGQLLKPNKVNVIKFLPNKTWLQFELCEGKNREIRKLCEVVGLTVDKLKRVSIENLSVEGLAPGKYYYITKRELFNKLGLDSKGLKITDTATTSKTSKNSSQAVRISKKHIIKRIKPIRKKGEGSLVADSKDFIKFRKKHYVTTMEKKKIDNARDTKKNVRIRTSKTNKPNKTTKIIKTNRSNKPIKSYKVKSNFKNNIRKRK